MIRRPDPGRTTARSAACCSPLRERMPVSLQEATGLRSERRRQRAEALGSVLRSVASVTIFIVAVHDGPGRAGLDLAPLLASAGIAGVALGFGAQNLVKDFIAGLFMLLEDQYGVGDVVDVGEASGTVEAVGLRITTIRDARGVLWYIRNGEIVRVGNRSQGWALVVVDVPVGFAGVEEATAVLRAAAATPGRGPGVRRRPARAARGARRRADHRRRRGGADDRQDRTRRPSGGWPASCAAGSPRRWRRRHHAADQREPGIRSATASGQRQPHRRTSRASVAQPDPRVARRNDIHASRSGEPAPIRNTAELSRG